MAVQIDVGEQTAVAIAGVLSCIASLGDVLSEGELRGPPRRLGEKADPALRRVDSDQPDPFPLPASQTDVKGVAVNDVDHHSVEGESTTRGRGPRRAEAEGGEKPRYEDCCDRECSRINPVSTVNGQSAMGSTDSNSWPARHGARGPCERRVALSNRPHAVA